MLTLWSVVIKSVTKNFIGFLDELGFFKQKKSATLIFTLLSFEIVDGGTDAESSQVLAGRYI